MSLTLARRAAPVLALSLLAFAGCGSDSTGPDDITGTYTLILANGNPPPTTTYQAQGIKEEALLGSSLTLRADHTFSAVLVMRYTEGGVATTENNVPAGTYEVSGSAITFNEPGESVPNYGVIAGSRITVTPTDASHALVLVFEK